MRSRLDKMHSLIAMAGMTDGQFGCLSKGFLLSTDHLYSCRSCAPLDCWIPKVPCNLDLTYLPFRLKAMGSKFRSCFHKGDKKVQRTKIHSPWIRTKCWACGKRAYQIPFKKSSPFVECASCWKHGWNNEYFHLMCCFCENIFWRTQLLSI